MPDAGDLPEGWRLAAFPELDSTNDEARRCLEKGECHGLVVTADSQRAGRGRRNAEWRSCPGNLFMSMIVEIPDESTAGQLAYVTGLAAADAIGRTVGIDVNLKWPNDLMLDGRKLGGILIEGGTRPGFYVVGLGINLVSAPSGGEYPAISLADAGGVTTRDGLLAAVCYAFALRFRAWLSTGFEGVRQDWRARAYGIGKPLTVRLANGTTERGVFTDVDEAGALMVQRGDGTGLVLSAGAVFFEETR